MAEEVTQEVMLEVWRQVPRFDSSVGSVAAWVMTIAHRRAVDRVRSVRSREDREDRVSAGDHRVDYDDVSEQVLQHEDESRVRAALAGLTELQREAVVLAYWGGQTSTEISARLGVPVPTVKTRLRDGLQRLRADLGRSEARRRAAEFPVSGPHEHDQHDEHDEQGRWRPRSGGGDVDSGSEAHDLTPAYAVDALEPDETLTAETHLAGCGACRAELAAIREALVASVPAVAPPEALKARVLDALDDVAQLPPLPAGRPATGRDELAERREARLRRRPSSRWLQGLAAAAAAVVVAVAAFSGYAALQWRGEAADARQAAVALAQVAAAPDVVTVAAEGDDAGWSGTRVLASRSLGEAVLVPSGVDDAPEGSTWQLWFVTGEEARPAGVFAGTDAAPAVLAGGMGRATAVAVTLEPAGGSDVPTTDPVALYPLSA